MGEIGFGARGSEILNNGAKTEDLQVLDSQLIFDYDLGGIIVGIEGWYSRTSNAVGTNSSDFTYSARFGYNSGEFFVHAGYGMMKQWTSGFDVANAGRLWVDVGIRVYLGDATGLKFKIRYAHTNYSNPEVFGLTEKKETTYLPLFGLFAYFF
jgi:hypothetical protein